MQVRRATAGLFVLFVVAGCGAATAGNATVNTGAVVTSSPVAATTPGSPADPESANPDPATTVSPAVTTLTVTTVTTAPPSPATTAPPPPATEPATPPTDLTGEVHGFLTAVDPARSQLTLDKIDWFTGAAAQQACAADGVTDTSNNWCTGYYWRNRNPALRTVAVSPNAAITVLDGSGSVPGSLTRVAERITQASSTYLLVVQDGQVTELREMYAP